METAFLPEETPSPPCLSLTKRDIAFVIVTVLVAVAALYVVAPLAFIRSAAGLHQERYITTVLTSFTAPTSFIGVNVSFAYFYKKDESRLRVVVSLPAGYDISASQASSDTNSFTAVSVLPDWACKANSLSTGTTQSFYIQTNGVYGYDNGLGGGPLDTIVFQNLVSSQGSFALFSGQTAALEGHTDLAPGINQCTTSSKNTDTGKCLPDSIGDIILHLSAAVDRDAWSAKYDAATP